MNAPGLQEIEAARERVYAAALRTPLVRLGVDEGPEVWLKLENLQPIGLTPLAFDPEVLRYRLPPQGPPASPPCPRRAKYR